MVGKDLLQSKTTWGTIVAMISLIATSAGYDIGNQDMLVNEIVGIIGGGFALYGRIMAVHPIKSVGGVKVDGGQS